MSGQYLSPTCNDMQQMFQLTEYLTSDPLISRSMLIRFSNCSHIYSQNFISFSMFALGT